MPRFRYEAEDAQGERRAGSIEADALTDAAAELQDLGLTPVSLTPETSPRTAQAPVVEAAAQQLVVQRERLLPPLRALASERPSRQRSRGLRRVIAGLEKGDADGIRESLLLRPAAWAPVVAACAAEEKRVNCNRLLRRMQLGDEIQRRSSLALLYPLMLGGIVLTFCCALASWVMPEFESLFHGFGLELPALTQLVLAAGRLMRAFGIVPLLCGAVCVGLVVVRWERWRPSWLLALLRLIGLPAYGSPSGSATLLAIAADFAAAGVPVGDSVSVASRALSRRASTEARRRPTVQRALELDLPTPQRVGLMRDLSAAYGDRASRGAAWANNLLGPVTIVLLGAFVGVSVVALFLPLFSLVENLS